MASTVNDRLANTHSGRGWRHLIPAYWLVKSQVLRFHLSGICFLVHFGTIQRCSHSPRKSPAELPEEERVEAWNSLFRIHGLFCNSPSERF